ncbi:hypothetical protein COU96_03245 [Candidatus Shapirobacteria bacterium CG10_big_fil_rev_8_21_14_0_10_38_14]|uniref:Uncharacterized protein n=1 Tax=Candidatus Shapirobacteria bacterium CG10_big_fil_rev_8_21_14_0_10_38_14 TaxID=1974483 RepID=A0A2M8L4P0_9BACT|nr:MAG: hypothetical protein COU96_03245 [Candidatus Shapirobacteria bacterium CG10_big_fil_rev_8_21_14_0_10_38_14]
MSKEQENGISTEQGHEPQSFVEKEEFLCLVNQRHLEGKISTEEAWYYEQRYGHASRPDMQG